MVKCEVLQDTVINVQKGSIVIVNDRQFELARKVLKPVVEKPKKKKEKVVEETAE